MAGTVNLVKILQPGHSQIFVRKLQLLDCYMDMVHLSNCFLMNCVNDHRLALPLDIFFGKFLFADSRSNC